MVALAELFKTFVSLTEDQINFFLIDFPGKEFFLMCRRLLAEADPELLQDVAK